MDDPRPELAAELTERLAPVAARIARRYREDHAEGEQAPPDNDRDRTAFHGAGRAALAHLRQLLAILDWAAGQDVEPDEPASGEPRGLEALAHA